MGNMYEDQLMHYGVMGMHWGIRRYQPYPAAYDGDGKFIGKKALKYRLKADKNRAREVVSDAEVLSSSVYKAKKVADRHNRRYKKALSKDPEMLKPKTEKHKERKDISDQTLRELEAVYEKKLAAAKDLVSEFKKKYGEENVKDLKFKHTRQGFELLTKNDAPILGSLHDKNSWLSKSVGRSTYRQLRKESKVLSNIADPSRTAAQKEQRIMDIINKAYRKTIADVAYAAGYGAGYASR